MIQSVLYPSPYSGCRNFSGWPKDPCQGPPPSAYPPHSRASAPLLCVDRYRAGCKDRNGFWWDHRANLSPPRAKIRYVGPVQGGKFTISGPSTAGPVTVRNPFYENADFSVTNAASGRLG